LCLPETKHLAMLKEINPFKQYSALAEVHNLLETIGIKPCQEQIDLSGFVANELSAFSVLEWRAI
jgi:hypothetical protein